MSRQQSSHARFGRVAAHGRDRRGRAAFVTLALLVGIAACGGDDDDAADSTFAPDTTSPDTTTGGIAGDTTATADTTEPAGTTNADAPDETTAAGSEPEAEGADAASGTTGETAEAAAAADGAADTTDAAESTAAGPTTTGPACEFAENSSLPLERCNMGPPVAVLQSILQADGYAIDTVDGYFGDQTLYAVRAFQEAEGIKVDGIVGEQTWSELGVDERFGNDDNGDGAIAPNEIDLSG